MRFLIVNDMHESILPLLSSIGITGVYKPEITRDEVLSEIAFYDGIIIRSKLRLDASFFNAAIKLKYIARAGAGLDQIDVSEVTKRGIAIVNAPEGNRDALGEHALGLLLSLTNKIGQGDKQVRSKVWDREGNRGYELAGRTIGLLGYGHMAQAFAKRVNAMGCKVIAFDKYKTGFSDSIVSEVTLEKLKSDADVFSIHVPLSDETKGLVDEHFLKGFKKPFWLLNTARGPIVDLNGVVKAIKSGVVLGVGLDVLENEKLKELTPEQESSFMELSKFDQVIFTPHVAGWSHESYERINEVLIEKLETLVRKID